MCTIAVLIGYRHMKLKISNKPQSNFILLCDNPIGFVMYCLRNLNLNVTRKIDNTSQGGYARREISPWLSQDLRTWTHTHQTSAEEIRESGRSFQTLLLKVSEMPLSVDFLRRLFFGICRYSGFTFFFLRN